MQLGFIFLHHDIWRDILYSRRIDRRIYEQIRIEPEIRMTIWGNPNYGPSLPVIGDKVITLLCQNIISLYLRIIIILHLGQKPDNPYPVIQFWENFEV